MPSTNTHATVRQAVAEALEDALFADGIVLTVHVQDTPDTRHTDLPCAIVSYAGSEFEAGFGSNIRDDWSFPVFVGLFTHEPSKPEGDPPGCSPAQFRQVVRTEFHNQRLAAVPEVYLVAYSGDAPLWDEDENAFRHLRTGCTVTATARLARATP